MRTARRLAIALLIATLPACDRAEPTTPVEVVPYTGPEITADDAVVTDPGATRTWSGERNGDRIVLTRTELCGDECSDTYRLTLQHRGDDQLPVFVGLERRRRAFLPDVRETVDVDVRRVEIQDWDPDGVVSGRVEGETTLVFWHDFTASSGG